MQKIYMIAFTLISFSSLAQDFKHSACDIEFDELFPKSAKAKVYDALNFLESIDGRGASKLHKKIFGSDVNGKTYCDFIKKRITRFDWVDNNKDKYIAANFLGYMFITPFSLTFSRSMLASVILHEAVHTDNEKDHIKCPSPFLDKSGKEILGSDGTSIADDLACDKSSFGSYAAQYVFGQNLIKYCSNCDPVDLDGVDQMAKSSIKRVISFWATQRLILDSR
jgi:hypothetical protein